MMRREAARGGIVANQAPLLRRAFRIIGRVLLAYVIFETVALVVFRSQWKPGIDAVRRFNKRFLNPAMRKMAGRRHWYAAVVHHQGRNSGKAYSTPVWAEKVGQSLFIPLPYGTDVDWCRNIVSAGSCVVEDHGVRYDTKEPAIVPAEVVAPQLPARPRRTFGLFGVESYLRLTIESLQDPLAPTG
jgi:hypothetical protein